MKREKRKQERLPCAHLHPDDGIDPREFFRETSSRRDDRKDRQLCKQVFRTLCTLFAGAFGDPVIQDLTVDTVTPAPDGLRLLISVRPTSMANRLRPAEVLEHIERIKAVVRIEVAASICRRKAPELVYRVTSPGEMLP